MGAALVALAVEAPELLKGAALGPLTLAKDSDWDDIRALDLERLRRLSQPPAQAQALAQDKDQAQAQAPVEESGQLFGLVEVSFSTFRLRNQIETAERKLFLIAAGEILLSAFFSIPLGTWLARGLKRLEEGVRRFGQGKWVELPCAGRDELARLTCTFNQMVNDLATQRQRAEALQIVSSPKPTTSRVCSTARHWSPP